MSPRLANLFRATRTVRPRSPPVSYKRAYYVAAGLGAAVALPATLMAETVEEQLETSPRISNSLSSMSTTSIIRSYVVYTACSIPFLIDYAPTLLSTFTNSPIPGLSSLTHFIVRHTFFAQFVPGESVAECQPTMLALRSRNVGSLLNYSAEADENATDVRHLEKQRLDEIYRAIDAMGRFEDEVESSGGMRGSSAFALKITGLIDPEILARASVTLLRLREQTYSNAASSPKSSPRVAYPGAPQSADARVVARANADPNFLFSLKGAINEMGVLSTDQGIKEGDLDELAQLWGKLKALGAHASDKGVKLLIDAEHTWYQPALDAYTLLLAQEFNKPGLRTTGPLVYGTFQSYLNRQPGFLADALRHAEKNGYQLGVKLVRGAYFVQERKKWADEGRPGPDPIWIDKPATDKAFNDSVALVIGTMARQLASQPSTALSVFFGTHNEESCQLIIETLKKEGLAQKVKGGWALRDDVMGKVFIAQLYGMKDDLTDKNASAFVPGPMPFASKYIAYGKLNEVMPFLGRRAIENKAVMSGEGGAAAERKRLMAELKKRIFG